jgi:hypothetical protein
MNLPRVYGALALVLALAMYVLAQDHPCTAKLASLPQVPELRGFHLGMTPEQVKARVPQVLFGRSDELGVSKASINPGFDPRMDAVLFADVRTVSFDFLDGRLIRLWIGFEESFKWKTVDEFVKQISQAYAVPDGWTTKGRGRQLQCADFVLTVSPIAGSPSFRIVDSAAEQLFDARRQVREDGTPTSSSDNSVIGDRKNKIYYPTNCELWQDVPENNRVKFNNWEDAQKAGYTRAKNCP